MLVRPHDLVARALNMGYALGAFNVSNLEVAQGVIRAAEELKAPVIVQTSEGAIEYAGLKAITAIVRTLADETTVPIVLHLDHGKSLEMIRRCIEAGYTSVMIDASTKPLAENIQLTQEVVAYAQDRGVWVEAEVGAIMGKEGMQQLAGQNTPDAMLTKPAEAQHFVKVTGVDALAVSVGTIHGAFTGQEFIRFELLQELEQVVPNVSLVVHGASGIAASHLQRVAETHVCKINVDTELRMAFEGAVRAYFEQTHESVDPREIIGPAREAVQRAAMEKITLFGSRGQS